MGRIDGIAVRADLSAPSEGAGLVERIEAEHGPIDVWVNNAGAETVGARIVRGDDGRPDHGGRVAERQDGDAQRQRSQPLVYDPFFRAHEHELPAVGGPGLGLSLVKMLVDAHGGTVEFDSRVNEGTTVTLWFPAEGVAPVASLADDEAIVMAELAGAQA